MLQVRIPAECMSNANRQVRDVQQQGLAFVPEDTRLFVPLQLPSTCSQDIQRF